MPDKPPVVHRQTIKQAKAAFKARGGPALSEREQRQLERSVTLDRRAWRTKEQEKRKAEASRKKQEKERKEREERLRGQLGSQRRCDKFGYKSSQFHLGAFLRAGVVKEQVQEQERCEKENVQMEQAFGDDGVDDETLLDALASPQAETKYTTTRQQHPQSESALPSASQWPIMSVQRSTTEPPPAIENELSDLWNELDSSTQVARELLDDVGEQQKIRPDARTASFNSGDFDLSAEDLEELEPVVSKAEHDRKLMPPPMLPFTLRSIAAPIASRTLVEARPATVAASSKQATQGPMFTGFTVAELESFVDDDLQLTQAMPG